MMRPRASTDSADALPSLLRHFYPFVRATIQRMCRNGLPVPEDDEDLTQEVMLQFSRVLQNYKKYAEEVNFEPFLVASIKHMVLSSTRKSARRRSILSKNISPSPTVPPITETLLGVRSSLLHLERTNSAAVKILEAYYFEGYEDQEIAAAASMSKFQIWRLRHQALKQLRKILEQ